jgi:hypothetical protein
MISLAVSLPFAAMIIEDRATALGSFDGIAVAALPSHAVSSVGHLLDDWEANLPRLIQASSA